MKKCGVGFLFNHELVKPIHLREYYTSMALLARGHKVVWFCTQTKKQYPFAHAIQRETIRVRQTMLGDIKFYPFYLAAQLRKHGIGHVWISGWYERDPRYVFYTLCLLRLLGFKVTYDPMDPIYEYLMASGRSVSPRQQRHTRWWANAAYNAANHTLVVTEEMREAMVRNGAPAKKLHVAWWGTDRSLFDRNRLSADWRREYQLENRFVIGWLGQMNRFKGIEEIILPLMRELRKHIDNVLFLIGGKGEQEHLFYEARQKEDLPMKMLGEVTYEQAPLFTAALDAYIVPTNTQTEYGQSIRPIKMFDAIALGVPVVITDSMAARNIDGLATSVLYAENSYQSFLDALLRLHKNYATIKQNALQNSRHVEPYTLQHISERIADLIGSPS